MLFKKLAVNKNNNLNPKKKDKSVCPEHFLKKWYFSIDFSYDVIVKNPGIFACNGLT